jgi:hypothetical protein
LSIATAAWAAMPRDDALGAFAEHGRLGMAEEQVPMTSPRMRATTGTAR